MNIRHHDIDIPPDEPFRNCQLKRKPYAEILTDIVASYSEGFVLALNGRWGTGKTTFVKMWKQHLENEDFKVVYFNAWENDFTPDPMVALMAELQPIAKGTKGKQAFDSALKKGTLLAKAVVPAAAKGLAKAYGLDVDGVASAVESATKSVTETLEKSIEAYAKKKETLLGFRESLTAFATQVRGDRPLVFIIDELDRCRPNYAVEVLEQMKHLFSVPGIVFVLSIDKVHLGASIEGVYGTASIDAEEYLRRFFDLEYALPDPPVERYCKYLYEYYSFDEFLSSPERFKYDNLRRDPEDLLRLAPLLSTNARVTLRQLERIFARTRLILRSFLHNHFIYADALFTLVYMAVMQPKTYRAIASGTLDLQRFCDEVSQLFPKVDDRSEHYLVYLQARLIVLYANNIESRYDRAPLVREDDDGRHTDLNSTLDKSGKELADALYYIGRDFTGRDVRLDHLTKKIDLTEALILK